MRNVKALKRVAEVASSADAATLLAYFRWLAVSSCAPYLSSPFVSAHFEFYEKVLQGTQEIKERWKRSMEWTESALGEALGKLYCAKFFDEASKGRALAIVEQVRQALEDQAAAVGLVYALIVETLVHREMKLRDFFDVVLDASKLGGTLFPLLAVALSLNLVLTEHRVPTTMVALMQGWIDSPLLFMLLVNALLLLVGCLMTSGEAILILGPILAPLAAAYGFDKVLFGIIMIVNLEIGFLTPPVGLNLLVAMSTFKRKFGELVIAAVPFIVLMLGCLAVIAWQPWIALTLLGR